MIGPIVGAREIRRAVQQTLQTWLPSVLAEAEAVAGLALRTVPQPRSWARLPAAQAAAHDQLPAVVVVSPGLVGTPRRNGDGTYDADWAVEVHSLVRDQTFEATADLIGLYCAAIRTVCVQHPTHGGLATGTSWTGSSWDELAAEGARTLGAGVVDLEVGVRGVADVYAGPTVPPGDPYVLTPADPTVQTHQTTVTKEPL